MYCKYSVGAHLVKYNLAVSVFEEHLVFGVGSYVGFGSLVEKQVVGKTALFPTPSS